MTRYSNSSVSPAAGALNSAPRKLDLAQNQLGRERSPAATITPRAIAARESIKLAYGADSPYARHAGIRDGFAVKRDDLVIWHKTYTHPNNMIVGVSR